MFLSLKAHPTYNDYGIRSPESRNPICPLQSAFYLATIFQKQLFLQMRTTGMLTHVCCDKICGSHEVVRVSCFEASGTCGMNPFVCWKSRSTCHLPTDRHILQETAKRCKYMNMSIYYIHVHTAHIVVLHQAKDHQKDWTAMPALPVKPIAKGSDLLLKLIGAELDQLADVDEVERKIGV